MKEIKEKIAKEAYEAGCAPQVNLEATHILTLEWVDTKALLKSGMTTDEQGS